MKLLRLVGVVALAGFIAFTNRALAFEQTYTYKVMHPFYGEIGTFSEFISQAAEVTRIESQLRIAVRVLGIVAFREEANHSETFRNDRLTTLQSMTETNGNRIQVTGTAQGEEFVVSSPFGTFAAPAHVMPSDPWLCRAKGEGLVVSTRSGKIIPVRISGGETAVISVQGEVITTRHFTVTGDKQQEVWLDEYNVPVMFRSFEDGTPIDFMLATPLRQTADFANVTLPVAKMSADVANRRNPTGLPPP